MSRVLHAIGLVPRIVLVALMTVMLIDMMLGVFFRYVVERPLPWTEEVGNLTLVWLTFIGGAIGLTRGAHFSIRLLSDHLGPEGQRALSILLSVAIMSLGIVLAPTSWRLMIASSTSQLPSLGISVGVQYAAAFVGALMFIWYASWLALSTLRGKASTRND